ncbi:MAG: class I SAM-dependent methyltransferase [Burkholderiales bacterium]|nr:class I SAM-dependent methyltransferase [Burkholderiales bacterium]
MANHSIDFFDRQFRRQARAGDAALNPFEAAALPHLRGRVLDLGCGLGQLALAAARRGCRVLALDGSAAAVAHLRRAARAEQLPLEAQRAELHAWRIEGRFDAVVAIGLLMFFDGPAAQRMLDEIREHVAPGGIAVVNVLVEGTTYMEMFDPAAHCLFAPAALREAFAGWEIVLDERSEFDAPQGTRKVFATVIARKPA